MNIRERPRCRKVIEGLIHNYCISPSELWMFCYDVLSDGLKKQLKKMILEEGNPYNLCLKWHDHTNILKKEHYCFVKFGSFIPLSRKCI